MPEKSRAAGAAVGVGCVRPGGQVTVGLPTHAACGRQAGNARGFGHAPAGWPHVHLAHALPQQSAAAVAAAAAPAPLAGQHRATPAGRAWLSSSSCCR
jgi:hypothetical protein